MTKVMTEEAHRKKKVVDDSEYGYIEAIPPMGWYSGAGRNMVTDSSEYIAIQDPSELRLPRRWDIDFVVTGGETRPPVPERGHQRMKRGMSMPQAETYHCHSAPIARIRGSLDETNSTARDNSLQTFKQPQR